MKMKKTKLANFVRLKREELLQQRELNQRQLLINQSEASLMSIAQNAEIQPSLTVKKGSFDKQDSIKLASRITTAAKTQI